MRFAHVLQSSRNCHFLAVSDEDGYVSFYDTRRKLPAFSAFGDNAGLMPPPLPFSVIRLRV